MLTIACAQPTLSTSSAENLRTISAFAQKAAWQGCRLVAFPEAALCGYDLASARETAIVANKKDESFARLLEISGKGEIAIAAGFFEKDGKKFYNAYCVFSEGKVIAKYRKAALFPATGEDKIFTPGDRAAAFKLDGFTFGLAICYDVRFPKIFEKYAGVDAMVIGACFFHERIAQWEVLVRARALELQAYAIGCNALLPETGFRGHSLIVKPDGSILSSAGETEQLLTAVLEKKAIDEARGLITTLKDAKKIKFK